MVVGAEGFKVRSSEGPSSEPVVRSSHEGFVESTGSNIAMIRRRVHHPNLRFEGIQVGTITETNIIIGYIEGIASPELVSRVKDRIKNIKVDGITDSGSVEQYIEDSPYSIFSTIGNTERPDKATLMLLDGRILLLVEGTPVSNLRVKDPVNFAN